VLQTYKYLLVSKENRTGSKEMNTWDYWELSFITYPSSPSPVKTMLV